MRRAITGIIYLDIICYFLSITSNKFKFNLNDVCKHFNINKMIRKNLCIGTELFSILMFHDILCCRYLYDFCNVFVFFIYICAHAYKLVRLHSMDEYRHTYICVFL